MPTEYLTDAEIVELGERRYFHRRLDQRGALPIDWTDEEVRAFVVRGVQPERVRKAGEEAWQRGEEEARRAQERQERSRGGVTELRNGALGLPRGEYGLPQALRLVRRHYERKYPHLVHRPARAPRATRTRRIARRTSRTVGARGDPPLGDDDPDLTPLQRATLLLLEALVRASADGRRTYETFLDLAATRIAAEVARFTDWNERP